MPEAAVGRIVQLGQAVVAHGRVRGHHGASPGRAGRRRDPEANVPHGRLFGRLHREDPSQRWGVGLEPALELGHPVESAFDLDEHARCVVATPSSDVDRLGNAQHVRSEADTLDDAPDDDASADRPDTDGAVAHGRSHKKSRSSLGPAAMGMSSTSQSLTLSGLYLTRIVHG